MIEIDVNTNIKSIQRITTNSTRLSFNEWTERRRKEREKKGGKGEYQSFQPNHIKQQKNEMKRVMKEVRNAISIGTYGYLRYFRVP